ncbi:hypothetical protein D3C73_672260 [compost metagenome]
MDSITVKQLAERANVSLWQYTPIFQKLTGKRPLDYLTELRISHSKTHLLESAEPCVKLPGWWVFPMNIISAAASVRRPESRPANMRKPIAGKLRSRTGLAISLTFPREPSG